MLLTGAVCRSSFSLGQAWAVEEKRDGETLLDVVAAGDLVWLAWRGSAHNAVRFEARDRTGQPVGREWVLDAGAAAHRLGLARAG